ncbi:type II toxin-antitoxin system PemK/MazF family protein [Psychrobacillus phage Perkons]|nr:type II toxin-antitoxin system PemK/MazF family protein [Psychrobacillus phage Perkons]
MKRGEIYLADLSSGKGSEQGGVRPVVIIQNDIGNKFSPTIIIACITSKISKNRIPTHVFLSAEESGIMCDSVVLAEQLRTIDKSRLMKHVSTLDSNIMRQIDNTILISLGLTGNMALSAC